MRAEGLPGLRPRAGRAVALEAEIAGIVRTMFVLYSLLIVGGIVFFVTVGLTQQ